MPVTVNKLDYIYKKLLNEVKSKMNDTVEISDEEYGIIYEGNDSGNQGGNDEPIVDPSDEDEHDYSKDYLTIELLEDGYVEVYYGRGGGGYFEYSIDNGNTWNLLNLQRVSYKLIYSTIDLLSGTKILIRGNRCTSNYNDTGKMGIAQFKSTPFCKIYGNIMSLSYKEDFTNINNDIYSHMFCSLFYGCKKIIDAKNLILPNKLNTFCYDEMFTNCTSLITAPELNAIKLSNGCYDRMFSGCTSLTTAPELPATKLSDYCYCYMFSGCTSLTIAPDLPATIMTTECYMSMFSGCTSLTTAPELPATILAYCCYKSMFSGCTSLIKAPDLQVINLKSSCYDEMFKNCSSLNYIKCLAINIKDYLPPNYIISGVNDYPIICSSNWVNNVSLSGTFIKNSSMNDWPIGADSNEYYSGIPSGWEVINEVVN